jgi:hypothetical protein
MGKYGKRYESNHAAPLTTLHALKLHWVLLPKTRVRRVHKDLVNVGSSTHAHVDHMCVRIKNERLSLYVLSIGMINATHIIALASMRLSTQAGDGKNMCPHNFVRLESVALRVGKGVNKRCCASELRVEVSPCSAIQRTCACRAKISSETMCAVFCFLHEVRLSAYHLS